MIAIICAMDKELQYFTEALENMTVHDVFGYHFLEGSINGKRAVIVKCGIGKLQAGIVTMLLIEHFQPTIVINSGVAGGYDKTLKECDIVCATKTSAYDVDFTAEGLPLGSLNGEERFVAQDIQLADVSGFNIRYGLILSADTFATNREHLDNIINTYYSDETVLAIDMESAAVARICEEQKTPWCIIRSISDVIGNPVQVNSYEHFAPIAAQNAFKLIIQNYFK